MAEPRVKKKPLARGEPVVHDVLRATIEELGRVGYRGLRIEDVAARAKVHKTTIYRRFPTKEDLVRATIHSAFEDTLALPDTGSLRGDLVAVATSLLEFSLSAGGQALVRMVMTEGTDVNLRKIVESVRCAKEAVPCQIVERAIARGEIRASVDRELLMTTLVGSLHHSIFALSRVPKKSDVRALVDLLLDGALSAPRQLRKDAGKKRR